MLLEAWTNTYAAAATGFGVSKQCIGRLVKRWAAWAIAEFGPRKIKPEHIDNEQELRPSHPVRPHVICFRVSDAEMTRLQARAGNSPERSPHKLARAAILEWLEIAGHLEYSAAQNPGNSPVHVAHEPLEVAELCWPHQ
jgi:hypothetical protein